MSNAILHHRHKHKFERDVVSGTSFTALSAFAAVTDTRAIAAACAAKTASVSHAVRSGGVPRRAS